MTRSRTSFPIWRRAPRIWYLRQTHRGIPVYNAQFHVNVNRNGRIMSVNNQFVPDLAFSVNSLSPSVSAPEAVADAAGHLQIALPALPRMLEAGTGADRRTRIERTGISRDAITARLMLLPIARGEVRLVWNFQISTLDSQHSYDMTIDAQTGDVWTRFDWAASDQYLVYPLPHESPIHTAPLPPEDGRELLTDPSDATASPFGWHDIDGVPGPEFTLLRGNNVHAYEDRDANNLPPALEPDCGPYVECVFPIDLTLPPSESIFPSVANLFYLNNVIHDIQYRYGFTELAGNFQANNYGRGGLGNDYVQAETQDGVSTNNANFSTPPDGISSSYADVCVHGGGARQGRRIRFWNRHPRVRAWHLEPARGRTVERELPRKRAAARRGFERLVVPGLHGEGG